MTGLLILGLFIILAGSYLFTNGVEWVGKRLKLSQGIVGSVLAGVGTAMPETMVPVIAIFFGEGQASQDVGIGAILGAPFMLSTLTLPMLGIGILVLAFWGRRTTTLSIDAPLTRMELGFFLCSYTIAVLMALLSFAGTARWAYYAAALLLIGLYVYYFKRLLRKGGTVDEDVSPLILDRNSSHPHTAMIFLQVAVGFGLIIGGAHLFVDAVEHLAKVFDVSPLILSLLITPIATELPEKLNSLIWIAQGKDKLAFANITGAMVFQSTFPVAVGLVGTPWHLDHFGLASAGLAIIASFLLYSTLALRGKLQPFHLVSCLVFYVAFVAYLYFA